MDIPTKNKRFIIKGNSKNNTIIGNRNKYSNSVNNRSKSSN